ncbi:uncharacterized protein A1O9_02550 [Exophiala aquamarina CBS 119918]|uniref:P-loop containing nucleoside triphosphate hydrolase protein n=1 Tax=Exophiala aquamarina CBS 119918 TaxID=1182545 RepID=A0A072PM77_9EURO|nr:uncharacterized protein A1O9_02550 [Exophiala aquamarina CBS 119918]KEF60986.1 hypothetical protein A1O9_02550 [Exophiala aquamarina CBS 119918]
MEESVHHGKAVPVVDILFLGSPGIGKATFLSQLQHLRNGKLDVSAPKDRVFAPETPLSFDVTLFARPYQVHVYTSTSTLFIDPFPDEPNFTIIAFSISSRESLHNAQFYWRKQLSMHYHDQEHNMPVMLLGLKRDERTDNRLDDGSFECVMPQEAYRVAQEMRCDRYAECSAVTGELLWEVLEDITRTAAKTTTDAGGLSQVNTCCLM